MASQCTAPLQSLTQHFAPLLCNRLPVPKGAIFAPLALLGEAPLAVTGIMVALLLLAVVATFHLRKEMPWWAKGFITACMAWVTAALLVLGGRSALAAAFDDSQSCYTAVQAATIHIVETACAPLHASGQLTFGWWVSSKLPAHTFASACVEAVRGVLPEAVALSQARALAIIGVLLYGIAPRVYKSIPYRPLLYTLLLASLGYATWFSSGSTSLGEVLHLSSLDLLGSWSTLASFGRWLFSPQTRVLAGFAALFASASSSGINAAWAILGVLVGVAYVLIHVLEPVFALGSISKGFIFFLSHQVALAGAVMVVSIVFGWPPEWWGWVLLVPLLDWQRDAFSSTSSSSSSVAAITPSQEEDEAVVGMYPARDPRAHPFRPEDIAAMQQEALTYEDLDGVTATGEGRRRRVGNNYSCLSVVQSFEYALSVIVFLPMVAWLALDVLGWVPGAPAPVDVLGSLLAAGDISWPPATVLASLRLVGGLGLCFGSPGVSWLARMLLAGVAGAVVAILLKGGGTTWAFAGTFGVIVTIFMSTALSASAALARVAREAVVVLPSAVALVVFGSYASSLPDHQALPATTIVLVVAGLVLVVPLLKVAQDLVVGAVHVGVHTVQIVFGAGVVAMTVAPALLNLILRSGAKPVAGDDDTQALGFTVAALLVLVAGSWKLTRLLIASDASAAAARSRKENMYMNADSGAESDGDYLSSGAMSDSSDDNLARYAEPAGATSDDSSSDTEGGSGAGVGRRQAMPPGAAVPQSSDHGAAFGVAATSDRLPSGAGFGASAWQAPPAGSAAPMPGSGLRHRSTGSAAAAASVPSSTPMHARLSAPAPAPAPAPAAAMPFGRGGAAGGHGHSQHYRPAPVPAPAPTPAPALASTPVPAAVMGTAVHGTMFGTQVTPPGGGRRVTPLGQLPRHSPGVVAGQALGYHQPQHARTGSSGQAVTPHHHSSGSSSSGARVPQKGTPSPQFSGPWSLGTSPVADTPASSASAPMPAGGAAAAAATTAPTNSFAAAAAASRAHRGVHNMWNSKPSGFARKKRTRDDDDEAAVHAAAAHAVAGLAAGGAGAGAGAGGGGSEARVQDGKRQRSSLHQGGAVTGVPVVTSSRGHATNTTTGTRAPWGATFGHKL